MSRISIKTTITNIFSTYKNNFFTFAPFGIFLGFIASLLMSAQTIINYLFSMQPQPLNAATYQQTNDHSTLSVIASNIKQQSVFLQNTHNILYTLISIVTMVGLYIIYYYAYFSFLKILLSIKNNPHPRFKTLFTYDNSIIKAIGASLANLMIFIGMIGVTFSMIGAFYFLLKKFFNIGSYSVSYQIMIPLIALLVLIIGIVGFYVTVRLFSASFIILEKNDSIKNALKNSWYLTKGSFFKISLIYSLVPLASVLIMLFTKTISGLILTSLATTSVFIVLYALISSITLNSFIPLVFTTTYQELLKNKE